MSRLKSTIFFHFGFTKCYPFWFDVSISHLCYENENNIKLFSICNAFSPYFVVVVDVFMPTHHQCSSRNFSRLAYKIQMTTKAAAAPHNFPSFTYVYSFVSQMQTFKAHDILPFYGEFVIIFFNSINYENDSWCKAAYLEQGTAPYIFRFNFPFSKLASDSIEVKSLFTRNTEICQANTRWRLDFPFSV